MNCAKINFSYLPKVKYFGVEKFVPPRKHISRTIGENIIYFIISGELNLLHNNKPVCLKKGDIAFFYKGDTQAAQLASECEYYYIHYCLDDFEIFECEDNEYYNYYKKSFNEYLKSNVHSLERYNFFYTVLPLKFALSTNNEFLYALDKFKKFQSIFYAKDFEKRIIVSNYFIELLLNFESLVQNCNNSNDGYQFFSIVSEIAKFIESNFCFDIGSAEIEAKFNFSYDYANRIFKNVIGDSIVKYRNKVRIDNAKFLLSSTPKSIDEITEAVGFKDKYYFTRYFSKTVGISPKRYRNMVNNNVF